MPKVKEKVLTEVIGTRVTKRAKKKIEKINPNISEFIRDVIMEYLEGRKE